MKTTLKARPSILVEAALLEKQELAKEYERQLEAHLAGPSETALHRAYEWGRGAVGRGMGVLDMAILHHKALNGVLARHPPTARAAIIDKAAIFFTESLSPCEMLLRQCRESNASLLAERKIIERQLRQNQKLETIGQLTGGIAHDFNNLLCIIALNVEVLFESTERNAQQTKLVDIVVKTVARGAELIRRLLAFARQQPLDPSIINLNDRVPDISKMLQQTLGEGIRVSTALADGLWFTRVDAVQLEDALINLAINARDAMPKGGDLTIRTANVHLDERYASQHPGAAAGDYVMLSVTDTGRGMSPEVVIRATEPFFTTKPQGQGTGLGLSMIYGFARQSGGHLEIESKVGAGTVVKLYLPRNEPGVTGADAEAGSSPVLSKGDEFILVVEDNAELRQLVMLQLATLGYKVRGVENGPAALAMLASGERFCLLFTDISLPEGMTGYELAKAAQGQQPGLKVLFTTGYIKAQKQGGNDNAQGDPVHMLRKPYRRQELAEKIEETLAAR